jgi:RNA-directed DNA polymerase
MKSITRFITHKLKLKVNETKSAVARPQERKLLGFSFSGGPEIKRTIAPKALERFKHRVREITCRAKGVSLETTIAELASYMRGWRSYFGFCETPYVSSRACGPVGVGIAIARDPLRRSGQALLTHPAPTLGDNV